MTTCKMRTENGNVINIQWPCVHVQLYYYLGDNITIILYTHCHLIQLPAILLLIQ